MDPASVQTLNNFGYSLLLQGRHDLALTFFRDAARIDPENEFIVANAERAVAARVRDDGDAQTEASGTEALPAEAPAPADSGAPRIAPIGSASCRGRVCQYV